MVVVIFDSSVNVSLEVLKARMEPSFNEIVFRCEKDKPQTSNAEVKVTNQRVIQMKASISARRRCYCRDLMEVRV